MSSFLHYKIAVVSKNIGYIASHKLVWSHKDTRKGCKCVTPLLFKLWTCPGVFSLSYNSAQELSPPVTPQSTKREKIQTITAGKCNVEHVYCKRKINEKVTDNLP